MKLLELFSSYYPFIVREFDDDDGGRGYEALFNDSDGKKVRVEVTTVGLEDPETEDPLNIGTISFTRDGHEELSGDGREVAKLFGTVIKAIEKILKILKNENVDIDIITFAGDMTHGGRVKLYQHLVNRFAKKLDMKSTAPEWLMQALDNHIAPHTKPFYLSR